MPQPPEPAPQEPNGPQPGPPTESSDGGFVSLPEGVTSKAFRNGSVMQGKPTPVEEDEDDAPVTGMSNPITAEPTSKTDGHPDAETLAHEAEDLGLNPNATHLVDAAGHILTTANGQAFENLLAQNQADTPIGEVKMDGVELLVQLAKSGQIDPWNVDITTVADQYLQAVSELKESDLKITGKTLLYLAILLRMKSDALAGINYLDPPEEFLDDLLAPDFMDNGRAMQTKLNFRSLDEVIQRRTSTKQPRIRPVTLNDLIRELKRYEELEKRRSLRDKMESANSRRANNDMRDYAEFTADDIEEMAHEEFIEDTIGRLQRILERILIHNENVSLTELMTEGHIDRSSAFLALLFLAARGEFDLYQESFYQELYIKTGEPSPARPAGETVLEELVETAEGEADAGPGGEEELAG